MRWKTIPSMLFVCLILNAAGCASVSLESMKDPTVTGRFHRIYVLIDHKFLDESHSETLNSALSDALSQRGIQFESRIISPMELDETSYIDEAVAYNPDAVLVIELTGFKEDHYVYEMSYDVSLFTPNREKRIWRAQVDHHTGGAAFTKNRMRRLAERIVEQLEKDELIERKPK